MMGVTRFPKPWQIEQTGPHDCCVNDANGRKLFYVVGDEGDGEDAKPSILFWGKDADSDALLDEIVRMVETLK